MNNKYFFEISIGTITLLEMLYTGIFAKMQIEIISVGNPSKNLISYLTKVRSGRYIKYIGLIFLRNVIN